MGQIFHTDIWPLLTSAEVNIRVAYEQKENLPIPKYITWNNSITKHSHIHLNNHVKYASWNKWVLVRDLKMSRDGDRLMLRGRSFHSIGAAAAKDLLPKFSNRHRGDVSWWFSLDRRVRVGEYGTSCSRSMEKIITVRGLKTKTCYDANLFVIGVYDNLWGCQWRQSQHHGNS